MHISLHKWGFTYRQGPWYICQAEISCPRMVSLAWAYCYLG